MANEKKKTVSLADLGVEEKPKSDLVSPVPNDQPPVKAIDTPADGPFKDEPKPVSKIINPNKKINTVTGESQEKTDTVSEPLPSDGSKYKQITDINKFLGIKPKVEKSPIRQTLDTLYEKADEGIDRTKKDLSRPGGLIEEGKRKYIEYKYPILEMRAKKNKRLQSQIDKVNQIIDTDPRFDGISDYERKAYILFVVGRDNNTGVDHEYFGIEEDKSVNIPRNSNDNIAVIDSIIEENEKLGINLDDDTLSLGSNEVNDSLYSYEAEKPDTVAVEEEDTVAPKKEGKAVPDASNAIVENEEDKLDSDNVFLTEDAEEHTTEEDEDMEDIGISEEESKANQLQFRNELVEKLRLNRTDDLQGFEVSVKPISLKSALKPRQINKFSYVWPLLYTGIGAEITPLNGDEIINLNPNNTNFETVRGLNTVFSILYHHIINQNKAPFETWLRQTSDYDIDSIIFGTHAATFKDNNYITYECTNKKCKHIFLQKKDIMDMVVFPNDETKQRFNKILENDGVMSQTYKSTPKRINMDYAIGFVSQSIYSNLFEPASLPSDFTKKYAPIVSLMPNIDKIYRIDNNTKTLYPINFGVIENSLSKTVQRKVKSIYTILQSFTPDERSIVVAEAQKINNQMDKWKINYAIPETTCPKCGQKIERQDSNPLNILFTRAQLPIVAAYIQE